MTEYLRGKFSVPLMGSQQYRDNWDAIFGKRTALRELTRLTEEAGGYKELEDKPGSEATNPDLTPPSSNNSQNKQTNADIPESQREGTSSTPKDASDTPLPPGHVRLPGGGVRRPRS